MSSWNDIFYFSITSAALLLSVMGLWFTFVMPGMDRWSKRFFLSFFIILFLSCVSVLIEMIFHYFSVPSSVIHFLLLLATLLLSLPLPMLTVYLLHCCGEDLHSSKLLNAILILWSVYFVLLAITPYIRSFGYITPEDQYYRGPLYPLLLAPIIMILLLNFTYTIRRRIRLSRKAFQSFVIAQVPMMVTLIVNLFVDAVPLFDISYVISALVMYSFILSDQIEQDRRYQQEIVQQQRKIARQQREIAHERASIMVLQMRPHFIYNTLTSIYSLCRLDPPKARQITMNFTNYLRKNFNAIASDTAIPFLTEVEHTQAYLAVEQAQYDDMLIVDWDIPFTHFRLPPLTLQPIVENAVKHGMNPDSDPLRISIRARHTDENTEIIVEDTGPGFDPSGESKPHTTLTNIRQRLEMMCGGSMTIMPRDGGGTVVILTIP
ncbi:MAG: histidine kinase [Anaerolineaceae bacterium]|nr:histidine kinase [Anaerolineaceae bacterium]